MANRNTAATTVFDMALILPSGPLSKRGCRGATAGVPVVTSRSSRPVARASSTRRFVSCRRCATPSRISLNTGTGTTAPIVRSSTTSLRSGTRSATLGSVRPSAARVRPDGNLWRWPVPEGGGVHCALSVCPSTETASRPRSATASTPHLKCACLRLRRMTRALRSVFTWLLLVAVPLQGYAATGMLFCGAIGERALVAAGAEHHHDHATSSLEGAHQHEATAVASDDGAALDLHNVMHGKCSACSSCCSVAALPSAPMASAVFEPRATLFIDYERADTGQGSARLERPPRLNLA